MYKDFANFTYKNSSRFYEDFVIKYLYLFIVKTFFSNSISEGKNNFLKRKEI